jgi:hypothetical protein
MYTVHVYIPPADFIESSRGKYIYFSSPLLSFASFFILGQPPSPAPLSPSFPSPAGKHAGSFYHPDFRRGFLEVPHHAPIIDQLHNLNPPLILLAHQIGLILPPSPITTQPSPPPPNTEKIFLHCQAPFVAIRLSLTIDAFCVVPSPPIISKSYHLIGGRQHHPPTSFFSINFTIPVETI